ncbi:MAG: MgtC/SapB family protein [Steroidobacteraceae bacterium]
MELGILAGEATSVSLWEVSLRLFIATVFGGVIGFDRERRDKPAGLRTHMLISLAAAVFTLIALELHVQLMQEHEHGNSDPIRIIEAVTSGVAFLAAGAIIQGRGAVQGITTGANMWLAGALGVACGAGYYVLALVGAVLALVILTFLGAVESRIEGRSKSRAIDEGK